MNALFAARLNIVGLLSAPRARFAKVAAITVAGVVAILGSPIATATPLTGITSPSSGNGFTCAVSGGTVKCWGANGGAQLGNGTLGGFSPTPTTATGLTGVTKVSAGAAGVQTCALDSGTAYCWGYNYYFTLGVDPSAVPYSDTPVQVTGPLFADDIFTYGGSSCARVGDNVKCWGISAGGQLGRHMPGDGPDYHPADVLINDSPVTALSGVADVSVGTVHACALLTSGGAKCWGVNTAGQLGHNTTSAREFVPLSVRSSSNIDLGGLLGISAGAEHTCALVGSGQAMCWGSNVYGQLGNGTTTQSAYPVSVLDGPGGSPLAGIIAISAGVNHTCALMSSTGVKCWGEAASDQLGFSSGSNVLIAADVLGVTGAPLRNVVSISSGNENTCAVMADSSMKCWGANDYGQLSVNNASSQCGFDQSAVPVDITSDGIAKLTIKSSAGHGSVTVYKNCNGVLSTVSLTCGITCSADIETGALLTLAATPSSGYTFGGWRGVQCQSANSLASCQFRLKGSLMVTAFETPTSDFGGDGKSDILWYNDSTGALFELPMSGFTVGTGGIIDTRSNLNWKVVAVTDLNGDGKADVVWQNNSTGVVEGLLMNGLTTASSGTIYTESNTDWKIVGAGDFDGDGKADLLWRNMSTGYVRLQLMDGLTVLSTTSIYLESNQNWVIKKVADFDGDGRADILWHNSSTGDVFLQLMNGTTIVSGNVIYGEPNLNWEIHLAADFNGDGKADILWRNVATGDVFMMLMNGHNITSGSVVYAEPNLAWKLMASGDYDGDGKADILWRNTTTGDVFMMLMNGTTISSGSVVYSETNQAWKILGP